MLCLNLQYINKEVFLSSIMFNDNLVVELLNIPIKKIYLLGFLWKIKWTTICILMGGKTNHKFSQIYWKTLIRETCPKYLLILVVILLRRSNYLDQRDFSLHRKIKAEETFLRVQSHQNLIKFSIFKVTYRFHHRVNLISISEQNKKKM